MLDDILFGALVLVIVGVALWLDNFGKESKG